MFGMQGYVKADLHHAGGLSDADINELIAENHHRGDGSALDAAVAKYMRRKQHCEGNNQLVVPLSGKLYYRTFALANPGGQATADGNYFHAIYLANDSTDPIWSDGQTQGFTTWTAMSGQVGSSAKLIINGTSQPKETSVGAAGPDQRRYIQVRMKFAWTPSQANVSNILSVKIAGPDTTNEYDAGSQFRNTYMRHRLKDSGGNPDTISKTSDDILIIEWILRVVSI